MAKLLNDERETHINMVHGSNKMKIYTKIGRAHV